MHSPKSHFLIKVQHYKFLILPKNGPKYPRQNETDLMEFSMFLMIERSGQLMAMNKVGKLS